jgi:PAS domain S-box-containing protein
LALPEGHSTSAASRRGIFGSRREEIIENLYNQVKELENRYRKLYEGSPEMYRTIDIHGFIIDCNQSYVENFNFVAKDEVIGHSIFEHTAPESMDAMHASFREWQLKGTVRDKEIWLRRKDGSTFPALLNATSLYDDNNNLIGSNTAITDMTEIQKTRKDLQNSYEKLKEAQKLKEDFIRIAAHDLRTPIQPILVMAELAKSNPAHIQEALTIIVRESKKLKKLADDFLDVAKIENRTFSYNMRKVRIGDILKEVVEVGRVCLIDDSKSTKADDNQHVTNGLRIVADQIQDIELLVDRDRMIQALSNLIGNSIKFTKEGQITVQSRILPDGGVLEITISDTGPGIPKEILPVLFERFSSKMPDDSPGKISVNQGTGLGLFISRSIVRAHGGDITAYNNESGKGATFAITIPIRNPN